MLLKIKSHFFCTVETLAFHNSLIGGVSTIKLDRLRAVKKKVLITVYNYSHSLPSSRQLQSIFSFQTDD